MRAGLAPGQGSVAEVGDRVLAVGELAPRPLQVLPPGEQEGKTSILWLR